MSDRRRAWSGFRFDPEGDSERIAYASYPDEQSATPEAFAQSFVMFLEDMSPDKEVSVFAGMMPAGDENPAGKAETIVACHEDRLYPPPAVMAWLAEGFSKWLDTGGETSLEACLGLRRPDMKAGANRLAALERKRARNDLAYDVRTLRRAFGLSRPQAAEMVAAAIADDPDPYESTTLEQAEKALHDPYFDEYASRISDDIRASFLSRFPAHAYRHLIDKCPILRRIAEKSGME